MAESSTSYLSAESAIKRCQRDITLGVLIRIALLALGIAGLLAESLFATTSHGSLILVTAVIVWLVLSQKSMQGQRTLDEVGPLIAHGNYDIAERHISQLVRTFSIFRKPKLLSLYHLATLRHGQRRYREAAMLCSSLGSMRFGQGQQMGRMNMLMLADASLEIDDLVTVHATLQSLQGRPMPLRETLKMLEIELDYGTRISAWGVMLSNLPSKIQLAELMPADSAARTQAYLALAALKSEKIELSAWLTRRVTLLADLPPMIARRPLLSGLIASEGA